MTTKESTTAVPGTAPGTEPDATTIPGTVIRMPAVTVQPVGFNYTPTTFEGALKLADLLSESDLVPKDYRGKPGNCFVAMQWGAEVGLRPLQALQNIAVINGRPCMWGDAMLALVRASPACEYVREDEGDEIRGVCRVKRRGDREQVRTFTIEEARAAKLLEKDNTWRLYPKRMLQMRARAFALRDVFTDVLRGMQIAEEVRDIEPSDDYTAPLPTERTRAPEPRAIGDTPGSGDEDNKPVPSNTPATAGMIAHIQRKLDAAKMDAAAFTQATRIETLEGITVATGNALLKWLADPSKPFAAP
jgi:hypothetical protein